MREEYKKRLAEFNATEKYKAERDFLMRMVHPQPKEKILDYGTGLGKLVHYLREKFESEAFGYDLVNLRENDDVFLFRNEYFFKFQKVIFMHSLAHIQDVETRLVYLRDNLLQEGAKVYIITPNKEWLRLIERAKEYVADPTLVDHFTSQELENLFISCGFKILTSGQFGAIKNGQHERLFLEATI